MNLGRMIRTAIALAGPPRPIILYHKPTSRCDCRCRFCDFWKDQPEGDDVLPTAQVLSMIDRAHAAGMTTYTLWGGEPLIASDLHLWLARAHGHGMETVTCTSGYRLKERAAEIGPHLDRLLLSLEAVGERQDKVRGTPGLFDRIAAGLEEYKRHAIGEVVIWSNLTRENLDQVEAVLGFAGEFGATVEFFPAAAYPGYNEDIVLDRSERALVFGRIEEHKRRGLPVRNTRYALEIMKSSRPFKCNLARLAVQVASDGRVWACEPRVLPDLEPYDEIDKLDLAGLSRLPAYRGAVSSLASCNRCLLPCVANMADSLLTQSVRNLGNRLYYRKPSRG